jgi:two-component system, LytTR family, sensor kinase
VRARLVVWIWIWLAWTALALFFAISLWLNYITQGRPADFRASLIVSLSEWWLWALLTPVPVAFARRWPLERPRAWRHVALHVAAGAVVAAVKVVAERAVRKWIFGVAPYLLPSNLALHFLVYWAIVFLSMIAALYQRNRAREVQALQTEARLHEMRLRLLSAQLQPHFLFNTLSTIAETVHEDADKADRMITGLSDLLRATLDTGDHQVSLDDELALARRYLAIQQTRFGDRLRVEIDVPGELGTRLVPRLLLQPLLENAVHHGVSARRGAGMIRVRARTTGPALELMVTDDGVGLGRDGAEGVGLSNTRARLDAIYQGKARLHLHSTLDRGTAVVITLPDVTP